MIFLFYQLFTDVLNYVIFILRT